MLSFTTPCTVVTDGIPWLVDEPGDGENLYPRGGFNPCASAVEHGEHVLIDGYLYQVNCLAGPMLELVACEMYCEGRR